MKIDNLDFNIVYSVPKIRCNGSYHFMCTKIDYSWSPLHQRPGDPDVPGVRFHSHFTNTDKVFSSFFLDSQSVGKQDGSDFRKELNLKIPGIDKTNNFSHISKVNLMKYTPLEFEDKLIDELKIIFKDILGINTLLKMDNQNAKIFELYVRDYDFEAKNMKEIKRLFYIPNRRKEGNIISEIKGRIIKKTASHLLIELENGKKHWIHKYMLEEGFDIDSPKFQEFFINNSIFQDVIQKIIKNADVFENRISGEISLILTIPNIKFRCSYNSKSKKEISVECRLISEKEYIAPIYNEYIEILKLNYGFQEFEYITEKIDDFEKEQIYQQLKDNEKTLWSDEELRVVKGFKYVSRQNLSKLTTEEFKLQIFNQASKIIKELIGIHTLNEYDFQRKSYKPIEFCYLTN